MVSFMESGYTQNTASMGHTGTLTVRPSPYKEEMSQSELALFQLRVRRHLVLLPPPSSPFHYVRFVPCEEEERQATRR